MRRCALHAGWLLLLAACSTYRPPVEARIPQLGPDLDGRRIAVRGRVVENRFSLNGYGTWSFTLESEGRRVECFEAGTNTAVLRHAIDQVREAAERETPVTATGVYRVGPWKEMLRGSRIELERVEAEGVVIDTDHGDRLDS
jgi:hypothetical protein